MCSVSSGISNVHIFAAPWKNKAEILTKTDDYVHTEYIHHQSHVTPLSKQCDMELFIRDEICPRAIRQLGLFYFTVAP